MQIEVGDQCDGRNSNVIEWHCLQGYFGSYHHFGEGFQNDKKTTTHWFVEKGGIYVCPSTKDWELFLGFGISVYRYELMYITSKFSTSEL